MLCNGVEHGELGVLPNWATVDGVGDHAPGTGAPSLFGEAKGLSVKF